MSIYDLLILGGGPGGYMAALHGAQKGLKIALIEGGDLGGTCLNRGCIPTKAMLEGVGIWTACDKGPQFGLNIEKKSVDMNQLIKHKNEVVETLKKGVHSLLKSNQVDCYFEYGTVLEKEAATKTIKLENGEVLEGKNILLATGSKVFLPPIPGLKEAKPLDSDLILDLTTIPESLIIIGAGVIGLEMATVFNGLGSKVTVIEMMDQVLPGMDNEIAKRMRTALRKKGINIELGAAVAKVTGTSSTQVTLDYKQKNKDKTITGEYLLVAAGRKINAKGIGDFDQPLAVNEYLETEWPNIYACGDLIGGIWLAHTAYQEGILAVDNILGAQKKVDYLGTPNCIFTEPQVASAGYSEEELKTKEIEYNVYKFPYTAIGKALAAADTEGMIKILTTQDNDHVLGIHILGKNATELIHVGASAVRLKTPLEELEQIIFAHPTLSEGIGEAFHMARGHYYHIAKR